MTTSGLTYIFYTLRCSSHYGITSSKAAYFVSGTLGDYERTFSMKMVQVIGIIFFILGRPHSFPY